MLTTGTANLIREQVQTGVVNKPKLRLLAEFNNNRFANPNPLVNTTNVDESMDYRSIVGVNRPQDEIRYAVAGYARCSSNSSGSSPKYRAGGSKVQYEYLRSRLLGRANEDTFNVQVTYDSVSANMLYANFNTHGGAARPQTVEVYIRIGSNWSSVGTFAPTAAGELAIYRQGNGVWGAGAYYDNPASNVTGIRIVVRNFGLTEDSVARVELVELATKYIVDVSEDVISFDMEYSKDSPTIQQPLGVGQAGSLSVTLDDTENVFSQGIIGAYRRYAERDGKLMLSLGYEVNGQSYYIQQPDFWIDSWNFDSNAANVTVQCSDRSRWIQSATTSDRVYENCSVPYIVQDLLETAGISGTQFKYAPAEKVERLPWVWYKNGESLWEAIGLVAKATNGSFYYNRNGDLTWVSKNSDYEQSAPVYKFSSQEEDGRLPNLYGFQQQFEEVFNTVKVSYEMLQPNVNALGMPTRQSLWQPQESPLFVRSADLEQPIVNTLPTTEVHIDPEEMKLWPFEGKFQIEGEAFSYRGKYLTNGTVVYDAEDEGGAGPFSGRFGSLKRAIDGTSPDVHTMGSIGSPTHFANSQVTYSYPPTSHKIDNGRMVVKHAATGRYNGVQGYNMYTAFTRGVNIDSYSAYGTEIIFPSAARGRKENIAGMLLHRQSGTGSDGYYFELLTNDYVINKRASSIGTVRCYKIQDHKIFSRPNIIEDPTRNGERGYWIDIPYDQPIRLEVQIGKNLDGHQTFYVYVDGNYVTKFTDVAGFDSGLWGVYVRGDTHAEFEHFYAYENDADARFVTEEKYLSGMLASRKLYSRITGDYTYAGPELSQSGRAGKFRWFFTEFAPVVHERKDFDVEYSVSPAFNYVMFNSNPAGAVVHSVQHTPFHTRFSIDNASRRNEYLNGEDPVGNQYLLQLLGQPMARMESRDIIVKDETSIREHGVSEMEYTNPWIQTEAQAQEQADYIAERWATPLDVAEAEVEYDPTIELGDLVEVEHFERKIYDRKYFVTAIKVGWDNGFTCGLTLRRNHM